MSRRHGYIVIDKPGGWTSHDVVGRVRRIVGERRVGHAGTLDPAAVGVLPVAVGDATRTIEYLSDASKTYLAEMTLGIETDSYDTDGVLVAQSDAGHVTRAMVEEQLMSFRGTIAQLPPMHSAIRVGGQRLYTLARKGVVIDRAARQITINDLQLVSWAHPVFSLLIDCSKGTYVRSLAHDLGQAVAVGAVLSNLIRLRTGPFDLCDAITLSELERLIEHERWSAVAYHPDVPLLDRPAAILDDDSSSRWRQGRPILMGIPLNAGVHRVYDETGEWIGIGDGDPTTGSLRPVKVITAA